MYILRPEANIPCIPQFLSTSFFGAGSLTRNLEFDLARLTGHQGPGLSLFFPPGLGIQIQVLVTCGGHFLGSHPSRPLVYYCEAEVSFAGQGIPCPAAGSWPS